MSQMHIDLLKTGGAPLIGRGTHDQNALADFDFLVRNKMSRADMAERDRQWQRSDAEENILQDYRGEIPGDVVGEFRGLRGARLEWARFGAWLLRTTAELTELESTKARLSDIVSAPEKTQGKVAAAIGKLGKLLLAGMGTDADDDENYELEKRLAKERRQSTAASQALPEIEAQIEAKKKQVDIVIGRTAEFLNPAMIEIFEESGIGQIHARKKAEFEALDDLVGVFLRGYAADHRTPAIASLADAPTVDLGWAHSWHEIENAVRKDARAKVGKLFPKLAKAA
jgi:hypothetical protein